MTYNVHRCMGTDRRTSTERIANVIGQYEPDIVALQELDLGRARSGGEDQPHLIAKHLEMTHHFHPSMEVEEEQYGNAVLSRHPIKLVKADQLPSIGSRNRLEPRGILWTSVTINGTQIQLLNTHLGLKRKERWNQTEAIIGKDWLASPSCTGPVILCGDFNCWSQSKVYKELGKKLNDVQSVKSNHEPKPTWFSHFPFSRIDHIFVSPELKVRHVEVPRTRLNKVASDHLPLIVDLDIIESNEYGNQN